MEKNNYRLQRGSVEKLDRHKVHQSVIRKQMVDHAKANIEKKQQTEQYSTPEANATSSVELNMQNVGYYGKEYVKKQFQKRNEKRRIRTNEKQIIDNLISKNKAMDRKNPSFFRARKITSLKSVEHVSNDSMKKYVTNKKIKEIANQSALKTKAIKESLIKTVEVMKRVVVNPLVSLGGAGLVSLVLVLSLFMGCFSVLAYEQTVVPSVMNVSEEVLAYRDTIERYCERYHIDEYVTVIMAIMMQESGGRGTDPMQCSESGYNTRFSHAPNSITDPEYSIEIGVKTFANCLSQANVESPNDTERLKLALQGYNYGNGYISWALTNFGGYTKSNARTFSEMMQQRLGCNGYGDPDYVDHVLRYVSFGFGSLRSNPDFNNNAAWGSANPYTASWIGQCTWFAWGRFYEVYGYSPGFTGYGYQCVSQLLSAHGDKFRNSTEPAVGAIFSYNVANNHVGFVVGVDGNNVTVQEGNVTGVPWNYPFRIGSSTSNGWWEHTYVKSYMASLGATYAVPRNPN